MRRVAVIGVGMTKFGKHERNSAELFAEAARDAITDAEISPSAIQALYYGNVTGGEGERQLHTSPLAASLLGLTTIPTTRFENACATSHVAFRHAVMEVAAGMDVARLRTRFGRSLRMFGGIDKRVLATGGKREIEEMVGRIAGVVREGGYVPGCDHNIPEDVPFENYRYYRQLINTIG